MRRFLLLLFLLVLGLSDQVMAAAFDRTWVWPKSEITVCFHDGERLDFHEQNEGRFGANAKFDFQFSAFSSEHRALIAKWVQDEYTAQTTGVRFVGFRGCSETSGADVVVARAHLKPRSEYFFGLTAPRDSVDQAFIFFNLDDMGGPELILNDQDSMHLSVVHEFGHMAGLLHEHELFAEAIDDPVCKKVYSPSEELRRDFKSRMQQFWDSPQTRIASYKGYDSGSIMTYCRLTNLRRSLKQLPHGLRLLSEIDREALKRLYPNRN